MNRYISVELVFLVFVEKIARRKESSDNLYSLNVPKVFISRGNDVIDVCRHRLRIFRENAPCTQVPPARYKVTTTTIITRAVRPTRRVTQVKKKRRKKNYN